MLKSSRIAALLLGGALVLTLPTGCSEEGCEGRAFHPDLDQEGAGTPIQALEQWLSSGDVLPDPPVDDWVVVQTDEDDPAEVVMKNDAGEGWWVLAARTTDGGWVVSQATDDAAGCEDELSATR